MKSPRRETADLSYEAKSRSNALMPVWSNSLAVQAFNINSEAGESGNADRRVKSVVAQSSDFSSYQSMLHPSWVALARVR